MKPRYPMNTSKMGHPVHKLNTYRARNVEFIPTWVLHFYFNILAIKKILSNLLQWPLKFVYIFYYTQFEGVNVTWNVNHFTYIKNKMHVWDLTFPGIMQFLIKPFTLMLASQIQDNLVRGSEYINWINASKGKNDILLRHTENSVNILHWKFLVTGCHVL